jgi:hypothetical protein
VIEETFKESLNADIKGVWKFEMVIDWFQILFFRWTLHAESIAFPDEPSAEERAAFSLYLESFAKIFPCPVCRPHMIVIILVY